MIYIIFVNDELFTHQYFTEDQIDSAIETICRANPDVKVKSVPLTLANI